MNRSIVASIAFHCVGVGNTASKLKLLLILCLAAQVLLAAQIG